MLFISAARKQDYVGRVIKEWSSQRAHPRRKFARGGTSGKKVFERELPKSRSVGIQCEAEESLLRDMDRVIIS